jgi:hypothetical protein
MTQEKPSPTQDEIAARTAEIREEWSDRERRRRAGLNERNGWRVPVVRVNLGDESEREEW